MNPNAVQHGQLRRIQGYAWGVGAVGLLICAVGWFFNAPQFFQSYLFAIIFWLDITLGCMALVMIHYLVGGKWGYLIRRVLETAAMTLPVMALLFVPLLFGLTHLYTWTHADVVAGSEQLTQKSWFLNSSFFIVRTIIYFAIWYVLARYLNRWSLQQDRSGDPRLSRKLKLLSKAGLVLYVLTVHFSSVDWVMSLEPEWYSTIYGILFMTNHGLEAMAFAIVVAALIADRPPLDTLLNAARFRDLGNLLLTFVMLWGYAAFSQFIIIWAGNLPEEVTWYIHRTTGIWKWVAAVLVTFHFVLPFVLLLFRDNKRNAHLLMLIAGVVLLAHVVNIFWLIMPAFYPDGFHMSWLDPVALIALGGIWIGAFTRRLQGTSLLPLRDPRMEEAFSAEEHPGRPAHA